MITGSLVALVTPMHPNGDIHWEDLDKLVDFHIENGTHGIVAVGSWALARWARWPLCDGL